MSQLVAGGGTVVQREDRSMRDVLRSNAQQTPQETALRFLPTGHTPGDVGYSITRAELDTRARSYGAALQDGVGAQAKVGVVLRPGIELVCALAGCAYANVVAVPLSPPKILSYGGAERQHDARRLITAGRAADVAGVLTSEEIGESLRQFWEAEAVSPRHWWHVGALGDGNADRWVPTNIDDDDIALLQYTSGSTGASKGVLVSSANMLAQLDNFAHLVELPAGGSVVSWMPLFHALGLGHVLLGQYAGGQSVFLTPEDFVADAYRWLRAVSDTSGQVVGGGPNFAFDYCVEAATPQRREQLDLSRWQAAPSGGERIRPETVQRFLSTFESCGFRPSAFRPGFGLTEAMQFVAMAPAREPITTDYDAAELEQGRAVPVTDGGRHQQLVRCGSAGRQAGLLIVDAESASVRPEGIVGEVWVRGPVVCQGYHGAPELTDEVFGAYLADGSGPFLRTGDVGFFSGGELVLCGRQKELIIVRGRNIHPQDVEVVSQGADSVLANVPAAAFAVDGVDSELLVVVQAVPSAFEGDRAALQRTIAKSVSAVHEVPVHEVLLVAESDLPRTASGKVRRRACREAYLSGQLVTLPEREAGIAGTERGTRSRSQGQADSTCANEHGASPLSRMVLGLRPELRIPVITSELRRRIAEALEIAPDDVAEDEPLVVLGMESVRAIALRYGLEADLGISLGAHECLTETPGGLADLIAERIAGEAPGGTDWPELVAYPDNRDEPFPLTPLQHAYLVGRSPSYELGGTSIHLYAEHDSAELDVPRLRTALQRLIARQEMLRSVVSEDGTQRIRGDAPEVPVPEYDFRGYDRVTIDEHLQRVRDELDHQLIPLGTWPMFDIRLTRLDDRIRVHTSLDLLIFDVASVRLFFLEWGELYRDPDVELEPIEVSFRDFVLAVQRLPETDAYQRARDYWMSRVATLPPGPKLPLVTEAAPHEGTPIRRRRRHRIASEQWDNLKQWAVEIGVTPTAVLLAAYSSVLGTWSGSSHFTVDVPLFSRYPLHPDLDKVLGDFTSVTLLEVDLCRVDGIAELAKSLQRQLWEDLEHRLFAGPEVAREAALTQGIPASAYASVVFASIREHGADQGFEQGEWGSQWLGEMVYAITQTPQVLLDHQVFEEQGTLAFNWDAVESQFPAGLLDDMFGAYCELVESLGRSWATWQGGHGDLLPQQHRQLIEAANDTTTELPQGRLFDGALEWARCDPDRTALLAGQDRLSYGELFRLATNLGHRLRVRGLRRNELVAISLPRSIEQIVAVFAVQLAGGAYLPLEPDLPVARQDELLEHSGARIVVTAADPTWRHWPAEITVLAVDIVELAGEVESTLPTVNEPGDLAYVLYTSGSTGQPKGVEQTHRATLNTLHAAVELLDVQPGDRALGLSQLSFDLSVWDIFGVLGAGAALVLPEPDARRDPARWWELMTEHGVTLWNSVPTLMQMLVEYLEGENACAREAPLRAVWFSGDWIPVDLPDRVRAVFPPARIIASGGPTETAIWCVANRLGEVEQHWRSIPYGRPMPNHTIRVLDDRMRDCPVWVPGEMYIGGIGLAEGYRNDPERTAAAFARHPSSGERLYRSGDLGRWLPDGNLEILGRTDSQVKIGGFRIESGEIEARLSRHDEVTAAAVVTLGSGGDQQLAAAVVPASATSSKAVSSTVGEGAKSEDLGDVELNPLRRLEFKAGRPGLRRDLSGCAVTLPATDSERLWPDYRRRAAFHDFHRCAIELDELAGWLENLRSLEDGTMPKYRYGSGGGLYPVQTYLAVAEGRVRDLPGGTYYYDPAGHRLVTVESGAELPETVHVPDNRAVHAASAFTLFLVAQREAVDPLYGVKARDFCLIETGLMTQVLDSAAGEHGLAVCQVGNVRVSNELREAFALGEGHEVMHALIGGARPDSTEVNSGSSPSAGTMSERLREHLAAQLPHYMVPSTVVTVDRLPVTGRGKLDRRALAELVAERGEAATTERAEPPGSDTEQRLVAALAEVLEREAVPLDVSFFDLGATSALLVKVHRRLRTELAHPFALMKMFEYTTVRRLAGHLDSAEERGDGVESGTARGSRRRAARRGRRREA